MWKYIIWQNQGLFWPDFDICRPSNLMLKRRCLIHVSWDLVLIWDIGLKSATKQISRYISSFCQTGLYFINSFSRFPPGKLTSEYYTLMQRYKYHKISNEKNRSAVACGYWMDFGIEWYSRLTVSCYHQVLGQHYCRELPICPYLIPVASLWWKAEVIDAVNPVLSHQHHHFPSFEADWRAHTESQTIHTSCIYTKAVLLTAKSTKFQHCKEKSNGCVRLKWRIHQGPSATSLSAFWFLLLFILLVANSASSVKENLSEQLPFPCFTDKKQFG